MELPKFKYHPDPIKTGAFVKSDKTCESCSTNRGYIYTGSIYCTQNVNSICPWCISDGSAAKKFKATFLSDAPPRIEIKIKKKKI